MSGLVFKNGEPDLHSYKGVKYTSHFIPEIIERIGNYAFNENDIIVATYPKAGTTWISAIVNMVLSNGSDIGGSLSFLEIKSSDQEKSNFDREIAKPAPRRFMTHLQYKFLNPAFEKSKPKVIYVMRNPCDNLVSFYHFHRMNASLGLFEGTWNEFFHDLYLADRVCFGNYFDHVSGWWEAKKTNSDHILYVKFEDMCKDPRSIVKEIATFLGKKLDEEVIKVILEKTCFESMKNDPKVNKANLPFMKHGIVPFMRKGKVGDWKNYFSEEQRQTIMKMYEDKLLSKSLVLDFEI